MHCRAYAKEVSIATVSLSVSVAGTRALYALCVLQAARVNAQTIYSANNNINYRESISFEFGWSLVLSLIRPHLLRRKDCSFLNASIKIKINFMLPENSATTNEKSSPGSKGRCSQCLDEASGIRINRISRVGTRCSKCSHFVCKTHASQLCKVCHDTLPTELAGPDEP